jgi:hypothetical protein
VSNWITAVRKSDKLPPCHSAVVTNFSSIIPLRIGIGGWKIISNLEVSFLAGYKLHYRTFFKNLEHRLINVLLNILNDAQINNLDRSWQPCGLRRRSATAPPFATAGSNPSEGMDGRPLCLLCEKVPQNHPDS